MTNKTDNGRINVTSSNVSETIVAVEKHEVLLIMCLCV